MDFDTAIEKARRETDPVIRVPVSERSNAATPERLKSGHCR
jgi:hypothetical protein